MFIEPLTFRRWRRVPPRQSLWTRNNRIRNPPIRRNKGQPMWRPAWREFVSVEPQSDRNAQPTFQRLKTQLPPVKPTDASKHDVVHYSGHIDLGSERCVHNPAGVIQLMAGKVRFLAMPPIAEIRLIWQNWRQISQHRYSLRFNRHE